jgi:hypothetical protein
MNKNPTRSPPEDCDRDSCLRDVARAGRSGCEQD